MGYIYRDRIVRRDISLYKKRNDGMNKGKLKENKTLKI